jgi:kynurenine formamidase
VLPTRTHTIDRALLTSIRTGKVFDLSSGWWPGMPVGAAHPPFHLNTYRTPRGMRSEQVFAFAPGTNSVNHGFISEVVSTTTHAGTHLDALCHVTGGPNDSWHGNYSADEYLGDSGALRDDASQLPPVIARGVLLNVPRALGEPRLPDGFPIGPTELEKACGTQGIELHDGDVVLIRTGMMREWPDPVAMNRTDQPGLSLEGAKWLHSYAPSIVGADNTSVEVAPSGHDGDPQPVHRFLLHGHGVLLLEWVYLEDLAEADIGEFLFIAAPLPIVGATGSLVRPLAVV